MVLAHRLGDRYDADSESLAQKLLVAARLDLVAREPRSVEHDHALEVPGARQASED